MRFTPGVAAYIGVTCARGGLYRHGGGDLVQLERLSVAAASRWPPRLVRILLARVVVDEDARIGYERLRPQRTFSKRTDD